MPKRFGLDDSDESDFEDVSSVPEQPELVPDFSQSFGDIVPPQFSYINPTSPSPFLSLTQPTTQHPFSTVFSIPDDFDDIESMEEPEEEPEEIIEEEEEEIEEHVPMTSLSEDLVPSFSLKETPPPFTSSLPSPMAESLPSPSSSLPVPDFFPNEVVESVFKNLGDFISFSEEEFPLIQFSSAFECSQFIKIIKNLVKSQNLSSNLSSVISLIENLWSINSKEEVVITREDDYSGLNAGIYYKRLRNLSHWFKESLSKTRIILQSNDVADSNFDRDDVLERVFLNLMQGNISNATLVALPKYPQLSVLISNSRSGEARSLISDQLSIWSENGMETPIHPLLWTIYALLAGDVSVTKGYGWLVGIACLYWYHVEPGTSVCDLLAIFLDSVEEKVLDNAELEGLSNCFDVRYLMLTKFIGEILEFSDFHVPLAYSDSIKNYFSGFISHILLSGLGLIEQSIPVEVVFNLEKVGLWKEAVVATLFHPDPVRREALCTRIIGANISVPDVENFGDFISTPDLKFLLENLKLNRSSLFKIISNTALNVYSSNECLGSLFRYVNCLYLSQDYELVHNYLIGPLGSELLCNCQYSVFLKSLEVLAKFSGEISTWNHRGSPVLTLLSIHSQIFDSKYSPEISELTTLQDSLSIILSDISSWGSELPPLPIKTYRLKRLSRSFARLITNLYVSCLDKLNELLSSYQEIPVLADVCRDFDSVSTLDSVSAHAGLDQAVLLANRILTSR
ncbi:hypothetical protein RCL1_001814 [Eukaryota sp. TZLM3-RCL]